MNGIGRFRFAPHNGKRRFPTAAALNRSFPDGPPGAQLRLQRGRLPTRKHDRNDFSPNCASGLCPIVGAPAICGCLSRC
jgi:hypothetical protein